MCEARIFVFRYGDFVPQAKMQLFERSEFCIFKNRSIDPKEKTKLS